MRQLRSGKRRTWKRADATLGRVRPQLATKLRGCEAYEVSHFVMRSLVALTASSCACAGVHVPLYMFVSDRPKTLSRSGYGTPGHCSWPWACLPRTAVHGNCAWTLGSLRTDSRLGGSSVPGPATSVSICGW